jgi:hypothetical protein
MFIVERNSKADRKTDWLMALVIVLLVAPLTGCSEGAGPDRPWKGYATDRERGEIEWFWVDYISRADCLFGTKRIIDESDAYRAPYGCLYAGYQNPYVQWVVNRFYEPDAFGCIARFVKPKQQPIKAGSFYGPVLKPIMGHGGDRWYCYLDN